MGSVHRVLFVRLSAIGDIVLLSPLIHLFHDQNPEVEIDFLTRSDFQDLVQHNPFIKNIILLPKSPSLAEVFKIALDVRRRNYSILFDFQKHWRSYMISFLARANKVYRYKKFAVQRFFLTYFKFNLYHKIPETIPERYFIAFQKLRMNWQSLASEIYVPDSIKEKIKLKVPFDGEELRIAIAPGAGRNTKMWPQDYFVQLIEKLQSSTKAKIILVGGKTDIEVCENIKKYIHKNVINLCGETTLLEIAAVLQSCDLVISNDTGVLHIAVAMKCRVIAIFGPTVKEFGFFPSWGEYKIIEHPDLNCRPCSYHGSNRCPKGHFRCMKEIDPSRVFDAVKQIIRLS